MFDAQAQFQAMYSGQSMSGDMSMGQVAELQKALTMGYGTDSANLSGGGALRIQSLDKTLMATIQENKHFALFNELQKSNATATIDEWTEQNGVGGFLGGSSNTEMGIADTETGDYNRRVGAAKYLISRREVSLVSAMTNNIIQAEAVEQQNGALKLLSDAEYLCFEGNSAVVPTHFDGIYSQIAQGVASGQVSGEHIVNMDGAYISDISQISTAAEVISEYGSFGAPTHIFLPTSVQTDLDRSLDPAYRVAIAGIGGGGIETGAPVVGIRTSYGDIKTAKDVFIPVEKMQVPFEIKNAAIATANNSFKPASVTVDATANSVTSKFTSARDGNYYYLVTGITKKGESTGVITAQVAIGAGKKAVLTITGSGSGTETGYVIYRSRQNGTNAVTDFRRMVSIPANVNGTTTYTDDNLDIPGSSKAYVLSMQSGANAINWRALIPMMRFNLAPVASASIPWLQLMSGYLRITKRAQHAVIKNIVPRANAWKPFV